MPEVIFTGPAGRIEGRYHPSKTKGAPIAIVLHPHPQFGGTMNNQIVYALYYGFVERGFSALRFNFRGVGRSQGIVRPRPGRTLGRRRRARLGAGDQPGGPRLLDRRHLLRRLDRHAAPDAPARRSRASSRSPRPPTASTSRSWRPALPPACSCTDRRTASRRSRTCMTVIEKVKTQKGIQIEHQTVEGANHFFENKTEELMEHRRRLSRQAPRPEGGLNGRPLRQVRVISPPCPRPISHVRERRFSSEIRFPAHHHGARVSASGVRSRRARREGARGRGRGVYWLRLHRAVAAYRLARTDHDASLAPADRRQAGAVDGRGHDTRGRSLGQGRNRAGSFRSRISRPTRSASGRSSPSS